MSLKYIFPLPANLLPDTPHTICIGPSQTYKTSLLFQFCCSCLKEKPNSVALVICPEQVQRLPLSVHQMPSCTTDQASRLQIIYLASLEDLLDYLARLHTMDMCLSAIGVDDLNLFMMRRRQVRRHRDQQPGYVQMLGRVFALLLDTVEHLRMKSKTDLSPIRLLLTSSFDEHFTPNLVNSLCRQFFHQIYLLRFLGLEKNQSDTQDQPEMVEIQEPRLGVIVRFVKKGQEICVEKIMKRKNVFDKRLLESPKKKDC